MAHPAPGKKAKSRPPQRGMSGIASFYAMMSDIVTTLIARVGWPGTILILGYIFTEKNATPEQKQTLIDRYVLGKDLAQVYPVIVMVGVFALVLAGQHWVYRRGLKVKQKEIDRLSKWKTDHQRERLQAPLHGSHG